MVNVENQTGDFGGENFSSTIFLWLFSSSKCKTVFFFANEILLRLFCDFKAGFWFILRIDFYVRREGETPGDGVGFGDVPEREFDGFLFITSPVLGFSSESWEDKWWLLLNQVTRLWREGWSICSIDLNNRKFSISSLFLRSILNLLLGLCSIPLFFSLRIKLIADTNWSPLVLLRNWPQGLGGRSSNYLFSGKSER